MNKLGLFCGTFNPIHSGHLLIAECARDQFSLERVIFVTSPSPPHRQEQDLLDPRARHGMVLAAISGNENFEASTVEIDREGLSYTIDTVEYFKDLYPQARISLIIGGDNVKFLKDWHCAEELFKHCHFLVAPRLVSTAVDPIISEVVKAKPVKRDRFDPLGARMSVIDFPGNAISASYVRKRLGQNRSVLYMVPRAVNAILLANNYYREK